MRKFFWILLIFAACAIPGRDEYNAGVAAWEREDYDRAVIEFQSAINKNRELGEAHQGLAESYVRKQQLNEALAEYNLAKKLYDDGKFQDTIVPNDKKKARVDEQVDWIKKAIELDVPSSGPQSASAPAPQIPAPTTPPPPKPAPK